ncbi:hypothetical protein E4U41_004873 [Claviceps citrina]|nr:hypothetical protein E4U41_004873 [Claviceps citrina]
MSDGSQVNSAANIPCVGLLHARDIAEVDASPTNSHRENELAARAAEHPSQSCYVHAILGLEQPATPEAKAPPAVSLQKLAVTDLAPTARFVLSPSPTLAESSSKHQDLAALRCEDIPGDVYVIAQSSEEAWFTLTSEHLSFGLFYDPATDDMVFENQTNLPLLLNQIRDDNTRDESVGCLVHGRERVGICPGPWRISSEDGVFGNGGCCVDLCDILLLRRRYCIEIATSMQETGSKRKMELADAGHKKRHLERALCVPAGLPEFMVKRQRGRESDIYALGITLLYLLKKTPLPDTQGPGWLIYKVATDTVERDRMQTWVNKVFKMWHELDESGIELLVKSMIHEDPESRISAKSLLQRMQSHV